jgi:hypothetical protein
MPVNDLTIDPDYLTEAQFWQWEADNPPLDIDPDGHAIKPAPEDVKMVDCARCGREMLGESQEGWYSCVPLNERGGFPPLVCRRILGRPYCRSCATFILRARV